MPLAPIVVVMQPAFAATTVTVTVLPTRRLLLFPRKAILNINALLNATVKRLLCGFESGRVLLPKLKEYQDHSSFSVSGTSAQILST